MAENRFEKYRTKQGTSPAPKRENRFKKYVAPKEQPVEQPQTRGPQVGYGEDMLKSAGAGLVEGTAALAGGFRDVANINQNLAQGAASFLGAPEWASDAAGKAARFMMGPFAMGPSTGDIVQGVENVTGPLYESQTVPGEYVRTFAQMAPGAALGPGNLATKAGGLLGASVASETAGQATKDTMLETPARIAGGLLGGVGGGMVGGKLSGQAPTPKPKVKELDELRKAKNLAYQAVDSSGARYSPQAIDDMLARVDRAWQGANFNPVRHDKAMAMVPTLQQMRGSAPSLTELDQFRQVIYRDMVKGVDDANAHFGQLLIKEIDNLMDNATQSMMASGDPQQASQLIAAAREANKAYRRSEVVMNKLDRANRRAMATGKGTNQDNAMRQKIDELINQNKGRDFAKLPKDVQDKMTEIVEGTNFRNRARKVGAAAPTGAVSGVLAGGAGGTIGSLIGGPVGAGIGAVLVPGIGQAGKMLADRGTANAIDDLLRIIQAGGSAKAAGVGQKSLLGKSVPAGLLGGYGATTRSRVRSGKVSAPAGR